MEIQWWLRLGESEASSLWLCPDAQMHTVIPVDNKSNFITSNVPLNTRGLERIWMEQHQFIITADKSQLSSVFSTIVLLMM